MEAVFRDVRVSFREYVQANWRYAWHVRRGGLLRVAGALVLLIGLQFVSRLYGEPPADGSLTSGLGWALAAVPLFAAVVALASWRGLRRRYRHTLFLQEPVTYTFGAAGITINTPSVQATQSWATLKQAVPYGNRVILTTHNLTAYFLDFTYLQAPATRADFLALLRQHGVPVK